MERARRSAGGSRGLHDRAVWAANPARLRPDGGAQGTARTFGRLACASAGCHASQPCPTDAWHRLWPVPLLEAAFHGLASGLLWWAARRNFATDNRLAIYLTTYGIVRFTLEFLRVNPPIALGLTGTSSSPWP